MAKDPMAGAVPCEEPFDPDNLLYAFSAFPYPDRRLDAILTLGLACSLGKAGRLYARGKPSFAVIGVAVAEGQDVDGRSLTTHQKVIEWMGHKVVVSLDEVGRMSSSMDHAALALQCLHLGSRWQMASDNTAVISPSVGYPDIVASCFNAPTALCKAMIILKRDYLGSTYPYTLKPVEEISRRP